MPKKTINNSGIVRAAGVLLLTETDPPQFLLMRHANRWDLPKGHCDGEETYLETAVRELQEETGITADMCRFDEHFHFDLTYDVTYKSRPGEIFSKNVRYFLARLPETVKIKVTEHESFHWFDWSPPQQIQAQTVDPLLAAVAAYLSRTSETS